LAVSDVRVSMRIFSGGSPGEGPLDPSAAGGILRDLRMLDAALDPGEP
jgi:hypothetical protein